MRRFHLELDELSNLLAKGFRDETRRAEVLTHLSGPCATCRRCLGQRAAQSAQDSPVVRRNEQDAVIWALRREVLLHRIGDSVLKELRPIHRHWARRTAETPLAFTRLMLEEGFEAGLTEPARAVLIGEKSLRILEQASSLEEVEADSYRDARALAHIYLADTQQEMGAYEGAAESFRHVEALLAAQRHAVLGTHTSAVTPTAGVSTVLRGDISPMGLEVLATAEEVRAGFELARGLPERALDHLETAGQLLAEGGRIEGRGAEHLLRRGRVLSQLKRFAEAREVLAQAMAELPVSVSPRLQLEVIHHQAALELQDGDWGRAYELLIEFKGLYRDHGPPLMQVQRGWLLARVAYLTNCDQLARPRLLAALEGFQRLGRDVEAVHVLMDLVRCSVRMNLPADDFLPIRKDLQRLLKSPVCHQISTEIWKNFLREALEEGWYLPWMKDILDGSSGNSAH